MKTFIMTILLLLTPLVTKADINVFACEPEWAALARELGGKLVKTNSATNALQDPHYIQARPSLISKVGRADLIICSGSQLEIGWLPMLLRKANNPSVMPNTDGFIEASMFVRRLDAASSNDRSQGDVHPQGNPHVQTNPHNLLLIAEEISERMAILDPDNARQYQQGYEEFSTKWSEAIKTWEQRALPLRGKRVIAHHNSWVYLEDWLALEQVATLEPVSGIPPTASHLSSLLNRFGENQGADLIIHAPFQSDKASNWLSERTDIPAVMLPLTVGGTKQASDLYKWFDDIVNRLLEASSG